MTKTVSISNDNRTTWEILPGNSASFNAEAGEIDDTIYGQDFSSTQSGLINWTIQSNGLYKGYAGYVAKILKPGTPTTMTDEAMSVVTGKTYQINTASKRVIDRLTAITVEDNGVAVSDANIDSFNYLIGRVTFVSSYTPTGPITITGKYVPMVEVGCANEFTLTMTANATDTTCMTTAQANDGHRVYEYGLKTVSLELSGIQKTTNAYMTALKNREELVIEVNPEGEGKCIARGYFKAVNNGLSGNVGDVEQETVQFNLSVPQDDKMAVPFIWVNTGTGILLSQGVRDAINAWQDKTIIDVKYLSDGTNGYVGEAVVTEVSLSGGLENMNEFSLSFQGSGEVEVVP